MPRQTTDTTSTWILDRNRLTWTLAEGAAIVLPQGTEGILDRANGSDIRVFGQVSAYQVGVYMNSASASLLVGRNGSITTDLTGVFMDPDGGTLVNRGIIDGGNAAVTGGNATIDNFGSITGKLGISTSAGAFDIRNSGAVTATSIAIDTNGQGRISNGEDGVVSGDDYGIHLAGALQVSRVINDGTIIGDVAIFSEGKLNLKNTGTILGDIMLGDGADRIDTRGGVVRGEIHGGQGDDLYLVSSSRVRIMDVGASVNDTVKATASYVLTGGLDHLVLLGSGDIDGTGNAGANAIAGNAGDNRIDGGAGMDFLVGGAGRDRLTGGGDFDQFQFQRGFDIDRIIDFTDGTDVLSSQLVNSQREFDALDIRQVGTDVVIDFGKGDRLILEGVSSASIDYGDFQLP